MANVPTTSNIGFSTILQENKNEMARIKEYEKTPVSAKARNLVFAGSVLGSFFIIGLFATTIIQGVAALLVTGVFCLGSFFSLRFLKAMDPLIMQKTKNFKIESMVKEARKNAVAQLDNQILTNRDRLAVARDSRNKMGAMVERLKGQINVANAGTPMHEKKKDILERVNDSYKKVVENVDKAAQAFAEFENKVKEYREMEAFATLANEAMSYFATSSADKLDEMLSLAAFEQIDTNFNGALISIENSARDMELDNSI